MSGRHYYGWMPSRPDHRDLRFTPSRRVLAAMPTEVDLTPLMGAVLDQGELGSCGPNAADSLVMYAQAKSGYKVNSYSRLAVYYNTRVMMGTVESDSGVDNRTMLKALNKYGFCEEEFWPYDVSKFKIEPPPEAETDASKSLITSYAALPQDTTSFKGCLASGYPFLFGFTVYDSFESGQVAATGIVPLPGRSEGVLGGHDMAVCGYDDTTRMVKAKNSWGPGWGDKGYCYLPYAYVIDPQLSGDFWVINAVPPNGPSPNPPAPVSGKIGTLDFRRRPVPAGGKVTFISPWPIPAALVDLVTQPPSGPVVEPDQPVVNN